MNVINYDILSYLTLGSDASSLGKHTIQDQAEAQAITLRPRGKHHCAEYDENKVPDKQWHGRRHTSAYQV